MPQGVEHLLYRRQGGAERPVQESLMPQGVEHSLDQGPIPLPRQCRNH